MTSGISDTYARLAPVYDAWTWLTEGASLRAAVRGAEIRDGDHILEIAVGTGILFRELLRQNPSGRNVGIDLTEAMVRRARHRVAASGAPFELQVGDARHLRFSDRSFDLVVCNNLLGLLPDPDVADVLGEIARVVRPDGRLVVVNMRRPANRIAQWIYRVGAVWLGRWRDVDVEPFVTAAGFDRVRRSVVSQLGIPSEVLEARRSADQR